MKLKRLRQTDRVLCVDMGMRHTGLALYDFTLGQFVLVDLICTEAPAAHYKAESLSLRCGALAQRLRTIMERLQVSHVAAELPGSGARNYNATVCMSAANAVISSVCALIGANLTYIAPIEIKRVVGRKAVSKDQVITYVTECFAGASKMLGRFPRSKQEHVADAMVCAEVLRRKRLCKPYPPTRNTPEL